MEKPGLNKLSTRIDASDRTTWVTWLYIFSEHWCHLTPVLKGKRDRSLLMQLM